MEIREATLIQHFGTRPGRRKKFTAARDPELVRGLEQMVDRGDARLEAVKMPPYTHHLIANAGEWWLVVAEEAEG